MCICVYLGLCIYSLKTLRNKEISIKNKLRDKHLVTGSINKECTNLHNIFSKNSGPMFALPTFGILPFNLWSVKGSSLTTTIRHFPINPSSPIVCFSYSWALRVISSQKATKQTCIHSKHSAYKLNEIASYIAIN